MYRALFVVLLVLLASPLTAQEGLELAPSRDLAPVMSTVDLVEEIEPCTIENEDDAAYIQGGRFRIVACWRTQPTDEHPEGRSGDAQLFFAALETAFFTFFDEHNVEVFVKVLDACVEPFNRYWFFASGITNVEVTLTVDDRLMNRTMTYRNPLGVPFQPILDTGSFDTCP